MEYLLLITSTKLNSYVFIPKHSATRTNAPLPDILAYATRSNKQWDAVNAKTVSSKETRKLKKLSGHHDILRMFLDGAQGSSKSEILKRQFTIL